MAESSTSPRTASSPQKKLLVVLVLILLLVAAAAGVLALLGEKSAVVASFTVQRGDFVISLTLKGGELEAVEAEYVTAPQVHGALTITHLWPEGEPIDVGGLLVQFYPAEFEKRAIEAAQSLERVNANLDKAEASHRAEIARLEDEIESQEAQTRLAQLQVEKMAFRSSVQKDEAKLRAKQVESRLRQARATYETQKVINTNDLKQRELKIASIQRDLDEALSDLQKLRIKAEKPGLVVYSKMDPKDVVSRDQVRGSAAPVWRRGLPQGQSAGRPPEGHGDIRNGEDRRKIRVGDQVRGGATILSVADLSQMQVFAQLGEMYIGRVDLGQLALIRMDALPGVVFHGPVVEVSPMARSLEGAPKTKVFDAIIGFDEPDERLKPGMSAVVEIVVGTIPDVLSIPMDAVFEEDGRRIVYRLRGRSLEPVEVELGEHNGISIVVVSGLEEGDMIALEAPTPD